MGGLFTGARVLDRQGMPASLTRRDLLAGGARLAAGAALAAPALRLLAAPGAARAADERRRAHRGRLLGLRGPDRRAHGPPVGRGRSLLSRRRRGRVGDQRRPAHDPRGGRAARSPRRRPRRRPRARAGRPPVRVAAVERARPCHAARQDVPRRRMAGQRALGRRGDGEVRRPEGRRGPGLRVARARRPRDRARRGAAHGLARAALRARSLLPLPQRPPEPDQLERRGLRPRRDDDGRHLAAAPRLLPAHAALRGRRAPAVAGRPPRAPVLRRLDQPGPGLPLQLPDHAPARRRLQPRLRRVREHHRALPALVRAGARRRACRRCRAAITRC